MFYEEFALFPEEGDNHRAEYTADNPKIRYILPYITDGYTDLIKYINHEWLHGLIDWGLDGDSELWHLKHNCDAEGNTDHWVMRLINFD